MLFVVCWRLLTCYLMVFLCFVVLFCLLICLVSGVL